MVPVLTLILPEVAVPLLVLQVRNAVPCDRPDEPVNDIAVLILLGTVRLANEVGVVVPTRVKLVRLLLLDRDVPISKVILLLVADTMFNVLLGVLFKLMMAI